MNKDEIMKLTAVEMRTEIAKIQEWTELYINSLGWLMGKLPGKYPETYPTPEWPTSLFNAIQLVAEAQDANVGFDLSNVVSTVMGLDGSKQVWSWEATFYDPIGGSECEKYQAEEDNAPLAVCRAYLLWKSEQ